MINKIKKISLKLNNYVNTKQFKWFRGLTITLAFICTNCICFLAGFFLNRDDNMLYKNNINSSVNADTCETSATVTSVPCVTDAPVTTTEAPVTTKISVNGVLLNSKLLENAKITDAEYSYTNVCDFSNRDSLHGLDVPLKKKSFKISYDGIITAHIDSSLISVSADNDARIISVIIPEATIATHEIAEDSFKISDKNDNMLNPITSDDYISICEAQNKDMEQKAIESGLFENAYSEAESAIEEYLMNDKTIAEYYSINFVISKS